MDKATQTELEEKYSEGFKRGYIAGLKKNDESFQAGYDDAMKEYDEIVFDDPGDLKNRPEWEQKALRHNQRRYLKFIKTGIP